MGKAFAQRHTKSEANEIEFIECSAAAAADTTAGSNVERAFTLLHERMMKTASEKDAASSLKTGKKINLSAREPGGKQGANGCAC
jgi:hypothetical protein